MTLEQKMDFLIENGIATEKEIKLVTCINGWNDETFDDIYYARAGPLQGQPLLARSPRRRNHGLRDGQSRREHELRRSRKPPARPQGCALAGDGTVRKVRIANFKKLTQVAFGNLRFF